MEFARDVLGNLIAFFSFQKTSTDVSGCLWISQDMLFSLGTQSTLKTFNGMFASINQYIQGYLLLYLLYKYKLTDTGILCFVILGLIQYILVYTVISQYNYGRFRICQDKSVYPGI